MSRTDLVLILGMLGAAALPAQSTDAVLSGTVTDSSGAAVAGCVVAARQGSTGVTSKALTNESGVYLIPLPPGVYQVAVEHPGFRRAVFDNVELEVGAQASLNVPLEVGSTAEIVEVNAAAGTPLGYLNSSVGSVVSGRKVLELPLAGRNAYDLIATQAGVVGDHFSGNRRGSLNATQDGVNVQDNLLNGLGYAAIAASLSVDRVEEFRIVTSPTDAELGRGSGQIQAVTRSGGNEFHGSLFEEHRNTVLSANTWFNNQRGSDPKTGEPLSPRNFLIRNQYGGRVGGPIRRNRTFFHFNYEGLRERARNSVTSTVYTAPARQGLFRFFPGVQNGNANALVPTVDLEGNPLRPPNAGGDLQTVSVFGRDPSRMAADRTGFIEKQLALIPLPNNYRGGDGLNTAGYTWIRGVPINFGQFDLKFDHHFNARHRLSAGYSHQSSTSFNTTGAQRFPASPPGAAPNNTNIYSLAVTSSLRANLLNEFRAGVLRPRQRLMAPWEVAGTDTLPRAQGNPYLVSFGLVDSPLYPALTADPSERISPVYQYGDHLTWIRGRHALKGGAEVRFVSSAGYDAFLVMPRATLGSGAVAVQNINNIPGLLQNTGAAQALLTDLAGSLNGIAQTFNSPGGTNPSFVAGENRQRNWRQREFSFYFKDDFKITPAFTLNVGLRYEWYAAPYDPQGKTLALAGGSGGIFGLSGTSFAGLFQPGRLNGSLTRVQPIGPGTANPDTRLYANDNNNFAPSIGLSWSLPWFGKNKTVLRAGYGVGFERNPIYLVHTVSSMEPGFSETRTFVTGSLLTAGNVQLPLTPLGRPLDVVPLTDRTQTVYSYDDHLRTPYVQNWNLSLQRTLSPGTILDVRYVGSKGSKLIREASINEANIFENGIREAFRITQAGGNSPLLDRIFMGLNIPGLGVVDGSRITGSDVIRINPSTQGLLTGNNVGGLASYLSGSNQFVGVNGGLLRRAGLPENFVFANPQFATPRLTGNFAGSTYHSLQVEMVRRLSSGWIFQGSYTWSKALGEEEGDGIDLVSNFRTLRDRSLDKKLLSFHRSNVWRSNGIWELPFGPGKKFGRASRGPLAHLIGGWQVGAIYNLFSGEPRGFGAVNAFNNFGGSTPMAAAAVSKDLGHVERTGNGVIYFAGLRQTPDPYISQITTQQNLRARSTLRAIADASGRLLMANPAPGQFGSLAPRTFEGPGSFRLDVNLIKRFRIGENKEFYLRADAVNATNSPQFDNPNADINSTGFGRITGAGGNRLVVVSARVSF
ncbi:MAG: carboxypeptidase regulatory-like domain-containing protein [Acidobacteria bacterium]|nr:carboxypeptidase regulatory-like domain-containing protein [Acidobacteriota bacterium]